MTTLLKISQALVFAAAFSIAGVARAQDGTIYPLTAPAEPDAIVLGTGGVKDQPAQESWFRQWGEPMARNVTVATLTPVLPAAGKANGAAVIVAPGGGFRWLSMNNEGWKVAHALADRGIAAFVLKYRLIPTPPSLEDFKEGMAHHFAPAAPNSTSNKKSAVNSTPQMPAWDLANPLTDAETAYALILKRAPEWGVDPERIGMVGFSAGAALTLHSALHSKTMKLAFIAPIYGGLDAVTVPKDAPPMFTAIASDDFLFHGDFGLVKAWYEAHRPVELHLYQNGGHGFGLGYPDRTSNGWFPVFVHWLEVNKFLVDKIGTRGVAK